MIICKNCGVELETHMQYCPLCELPVEEHNFIKLSTAQNKNIVNKNRSMTQPQRKATWEIVSIIILLVIMVTSLLNFILNKEISWAEYPMAACLVIFSYVSVFAFLHKRTEIQIFYVFILASFLIFLLDIITQNLSWSIYLGIPLLFSLNAVLAGTIIVCRKTRHKGINLIAYAFIAVAIFCLGAEVVIDQYINASIKLVWSLIVAGSILPIVTVFLFMHIRLKKGKDLYRVFHT